VVERHVRGTLKREQRTVSTPCALGPLLCGSVSSVIRRPSISRGRVGERERGRTGTSAAFQALAVRGIETGNNGGNGGGGAGNCEPGPEAVKRRKRRSRRRIDQTGSSELCASLRSLW
jgi:hypothetical protein